VDDASTPLRLMEVTLGPLKGEESRKLSLSDFAALMVGDLVLRDASTAAGAPWQWGRFAPIRRRDPRGDLPIRSRQQSLGIGTDVLSYHQHQLAHYWALRAWLALEQGRTATAREYARKVFSFHWFGRGRSNPLPLAALIVELTEQEGKQR